MHNTFAIQLHIRKNILEIINTLTLDQLQKIPEHFNNNILWNIGHIIVVQQMLVYKLSGLPMMVNDQMVEMYKRGTKPTNIISENEIEEMKKLLFTTIEQTKIDVEQEIFKDYTTFKTMTGFVCTNVNDALQFNTIHEGIHMGMMMQLKKMV